MCDALVRHRADARASREALGLGLPLLRGGLRVGKWAAITMGVRTHECSDAEKRATGRPGGAVGETERMAT